MSDETRTTHELWCDIAGALDVWAWETSSSPTPYKIQQAFGALIVQVGPQAALDALQSLAEEMEENAMDGKPKTCANCASWKTPERTACSSAGVCPWYTIHLGVLCEVVDRLGDLRTFGSFSCGRYEDKPKGPFVIRDSKFTKCTRVTFESEGFTVRVERDEAERLVEWLNELWAERKDR